MRKDETGSKDLIVVTNNSGLTRWAPLVVVFSVVAGFMTLSWYAYHAGIQSVKEDDLVVVEADKTPIKEKPADPGGMQFPNQDKTVFETFSGKSTQPAKVERVLPEPEEPMPKDADASETTTWVNHDIPKKPATEQVISRNTKGEGTRVSLPITVADAQNTYTKGDKSDHQIIAAQSSEDDQSVTYIAPKAHPASAPAAQPQKDEDTAASPQAESEKAVSEANAADNGSAAEEPKDDQTAAPAKAAPAAHMKSGRQDMLSAEKTAPAPAREEKAQKHEKPKPAAHESASGNSVVQLGAYRSQAEADEAWDKMHLRQKLLSDKKPIVVRADLGSKGIYYRLRVGGLGSPEAAKSFCRQLTAKGQACIIPIGK